jgi:hypothetical protein
MRVRVERWIVDLSSFPDLLVIYLGMRVKLKRWTVSICARHHAELRFSMDFGAARP